VLPYLVMDLFRMSINMLLLRGFEDIGFHRYKPGLLSYEIALIGAYCLVKPVIPGVAFIR
jgi:hypothetical protein